MDDILKDERFTHIASDPRYKKIPKAHRKVKIDKRFQSIFSDKKFQVNYTVDKRGKPVKQSSSENFRKYYDLSSDESDDEAEDAENDTDELEIEEKSTDKKSKKVDLEKSRRTKSNKLKDASSSTAVNNELDDSDDSEHDFISKTKSSKSKIGEPDSADDSSNSDDNDDVEDKLDVSFESSKKRQELLSHDIREKLHDLKVDYARGMGTLMTDSSSDEESSEDSDGGDESEIEHDWGELDKDAGSTDTETHRLAMCNMDWDRVRAVDLMVLCSSFAPSGGHIKSITIYPSEFGLKRLKEEEVKGPAELVEEKLADDGDELNQEDSKEGSTYHMERLRKYQLNRLKYYYAVLVCDSVETASKVYAECDGMEYESSSTRLDLRFIPDDVEFDQEPKEVCTELPDAEKYQPRFFVNTALQQGKVDCTWDETDPAREQLAAKLLQSKGGEDYTNDADLEMFLASSSEEDEGDEGLCKNNSNDLQENGDSISSDVDDDDDDDDKEGKECSSSKSLEKYRSLLNKLQADEEKKKHRDVEMEITWGVGLKEKTKSLVDKKLKENELTPFEKMIEKKKEKRKQKREGKSKKKSGNVDSGNESDGDCEDNVAFSDDELPDDIDLDDEYFKEEFSGDQAHKRKKDKVKKKRGDKEELDSDEEKRKNELELLLIDDEDEQTGKNHFNLKKIQEVEENQGKKRRKGRKQIKKKKQQEALVEDDFKVDLKDNRFNAVFSVPEYNIDPSDSHFRKTKGMDAFIQEKISRKYTQENNSNGFKPSKIRKLDTEMSAVVASIKNKTKKFR